MAAILKTFAGLNFIFSSVLCSTSMHVSKSSIKPSEANIVKGKPNIYQVLEFGSREYIREYICVYILISVPKTFISSNTTCLYFVIFLSMD